MAVTKKSVVTSSPSKKQTKKSPAKVTKATPTSKLHTAVMY